MSDNFDDTRSLLGYRPDISFTEPPQKPGTSPPLEVEDQLFDAKELRTKVIDTADAVNALAGAIQSKVDKRADGLVIQLSPTTDAAVIASMRRMFGVTGEESQQIMYQQYLRCRKRISDQGKAIGERTTMTKDKIDQMKPLVPQTSQGPQPMSVGFTNLGGANSISSQQGGLRPELQTSGMLVEPLDLGQFQADILAVLVDKIWSDFLYPVLSPMPVIGEVVPETIVHVSPEAKSMLESVFSSIPTF